MWMIYASGSYQYGERSLLGQCNSCPFITFFKDFSGVVKDEGGGLIFSFTWKMEKDKLILKHLKNNNDDNYLQSGTYQLVHDKKPGGHRIALLDTVRCFKYMLD
jgi:hypothetical protein